MTGTLSPGTYFMTGCASGIGRHVAGLLLERGDRVYATDVHLDALKKCATDDRWPGERLRCDLLDVRNYEDWNVVFARAVDAFGRIDVCMNIAGVMLSGWAHEQPAHEVDLQIDVNTKGVIWGTQAAARHMIEKGGGHIVNISSMAGIGSIPGIAVYTASKHAVRGFSLAAAFELKKYGIAVTAVCPDAIKTPLLEQSARHEAGAVVFSGSRLLTLEEVGRIILDRVLVRRELEVTIPRGRGLLARLGNLFPWASHGLLTSLQKIGRAHQRDLAKEDPRGN